METIDEKVKDLIEKMNDEFTQNALLDYSNDEENSNYSLKTIGDCFIPPQLNTNNNGKITKAIYSNI